MDWSQRIWFKEDELYAPKRKVNNRGSKWHPHIIGSFYSRTNQRPVEYESLNERLFYYFLELDSQVIRYYVQPILVPMFSGNKEWFHIPDVLVFRNGYRPLLYQIKDKPSDNLNEQTQRCNEQCLTIAVEFNWEYQVIFPKTLPSPLPRNINFLSGFLRSRRYYANWYSPLMYRLTCIGPCSVDQLASSFIGTIDPLFIKPLIYFLIAKGDLLVDVNLQINSKSIVSINSQMHSPISIENGVILDGN